MKKLFFLALMAFLWLPATTWASTDEHTGDENDSGVLENGDIWDDEQEENLGSIVPSSVQLEYKILTAPQGDVNEEGYVNGTVELDNIYAVTEGSSVGALYIPHEIQVVTVEGTTATVNLYTVVAIANNAFRVGSSYNSYNNTITSVSIPYTVTSVGQYAFYNNNRMSSVVFALDGEGNSQLETIGMWAFYNNVFTSVTIPSSVTTIQTASFYYCRNLTSVYIPSSIEQVRMQAFYGCSALTTVTMSGSTTLGDNAFGECTSLNAIVLEGGPGENGGSESGAPFAKDNGEAITLYVETGLAADYLASNWELDLEEDTDETLSWNFLAVNFSSVGNDEEGTYYATFYTDAVGEFSSDVTPNIVTEAGESGAITYDAVTGYIPAGTGLLLTASSYEALNSGDTYYYHPYGVDENSETASVEGNMLYGSTTAAQTNVNGVTSGYYFYKLSRNAAGDDYSVGFYWDNETGGAFTCPAYKAYLAVPISSDDDNPAPTHYSFKNGEGDTTGISSIENASEKAVSGIYTIQGVRVSNMNQPGLYIVDGKKVLVK